MENYNYNNYLYIINNLQMLHTLQKNYWVGDGLTHELFFKKNMYLYFIVYRRCENNNHS